MDLFKAERELSDQRFADQATATATALFTSEKAITTAFEAHEKFVTSAFSAYERATSAALTVSVVRVFGTVSGLK
jgi:hypothetical protein